MQTAVSAASAVALENSLTSSELEQANLHLAQTRDAVLGRHSWRQLEPGRVKYIFTHSSASRFPCTGTRNQRDLTPDFCLAVPPVLPDKSSIRFTVTIPRNHMQIIMESMVGCPLFAAPLLAPENTSALAL
jgi:hypothetical protein